MLTRYQFSERIKYRLVKRVGALGVEWKDLSWHQSDQLSYRPSIEKCLAVPAASYLLGSLPHLVVSSLGPVGRIEPQRGIKATTQCRHLLLKCFSTKLTAEPLHLNW